MSRAPRPHPLATRTAQVAVAACALLVTGQLATASPASAEPAPAGEATFVDLGTAASYSVLGGTTVANTGAGTVLWGDVGLHPGGGITGFPPGTHKGAMHDADEAAEVAQADRLAAYEDAAGQASTGTFAGDQAGAKFLPGVHTSAAAITNTGTMTLDADGDSNAVFIFQVGAAFSGAAASKVVLANGALANNVYWQVNGAVALGAGAKHVGTILGAGAITFGEGASLKGRALTPTSVAMTNSPFADPIDDLTPPTVSIDGGATRSTNDTTPSISGTTDEPAGSAVTVTVDGQALSAKVTTEGSWSVGANALASGPHDVVASSKDASQNTGTDEQVLTVDTTKPTVSINGGARSATNNTTPTIAGTTDEPNNPTVTVTVDKQTLTTTAGNAGHWRVTAATLAEEAHSVVASVEDAAGNTGTASQILTVDVTVPVVSIVGGAERATDDLSPWIAGTTAEKAGTVVDVTIDGQTLTATVGTGGGWDVSARDVPTGTHRVEASIIDAAGNTGFAAQTLTVRGDVEPEARYQPDAAIRSVPGRFVGAGVYQVSEQRVAKQLRGDARLATFEVRVTNRGDAADQIKLLGTPRNGSFKVTYLAGTENVTSAVTAGTYHTDQLAAGASARLRVKVTKTKAASRGDSRTFKVRASSAHRPTAMDTVAAAVRVTK